MVTMVLLNVALMWATPRLTLRRCLRFLLLATDAILLCVNRAFPSRPSCQPRFCAVPCGCGRSCACVGRAPADYDGGVAPGSTEYLSTGRCSAESGAAADLRPC